jgi:hypothetical protein
MLGNKEKEVGVMIIMSLFTKITSRRLIVNGRHEAVACNTCFPM